MPRISFALLVLMLGAAGAQGQDPHGPAARLDPSHQAFLRQYCHACHNAQKQKGKVRLDDLSFTLDSVERADLWQKVLNNLNSGEMPPQEEPQPRPEAKATFLEALSQTMVLARRHLSDSGGRITLRRLNQREYKNSIRDLLGVEVNARELPADGGAGTFDTVGSSLFMSSDQVEQYLALGREALDNHFSRFIGSAPTQVTPIHIEAEASNARIIKGYEQRLDERRRYEQWTAAVDAAAALPNNLALAAELRAAKPHDDTHWYGQWQRIEGAPPPSQFGFVDATRADHSGRRDWLHYVPHHRAYVEHPLTKTGTFLTIDDAYINSRQLFRLPAEWPAGEYLITLRIAAMDGIPRARRFVEFGPQHDSGVCAVASTHEVTGTRQQPQLLQIPIKLQAGGPRVFMLRERGSHDSDGLANRLFAEAKQRNGIGPEFNLWLDWIEAKAAATTPVKIMRQRREVELHANAMVGGTYKGYYQQGAANAQAFLDGKRPQKGIPDETEARFRLRVFEQHGPSFDRYLKDPLNQTGAQLTIFNAHTEEIIALPPDQPSGWLKTKHEVEQVPAGEYRLRVRIAALPDTSKSRHFLEVGSRAEPNQFNLIKTFEIQGSLQQPQTLELTVNLSANSPRSFVLRERRDVKLDNAWYNETVKQTKVGPPPALWIDWVEWEGPLPAAGQDEVMPVMKLAQPDPRAILQRFARRAFRGREPSAAYLDKLMLLHEARRQAGEAAEVAIREPLSAVLASPGFLYLAEPQANLKPTRLSGPEFASRLSYFLWSAPPDEALLAADLNQPAILEREVRRLIASPKSWEWVSGFVPQWLGMERLDFFQFDTTLHRDFDESTKAAARREVYETLAHLLRHEGSLRHLLKSDQIHINGLLAQYYGIEGISGDAFRPVTVPPDSPRGGLLGMAAIMAMGSNGQRSSPVERGAWVMRKLLHQPPPPAPPNVPQLSRLEGRLLSSRETLAMHQEQAQCAQCHRRIDPIGFGLENFDAAGKWRHLEEIDKRASGRLTWAIDARGQWPNGQGFTNYFEMRNQLAAMPQHLARGLAEALVEYALGRPVSFADQDLIERMVESCARQDYSLSALILALTSSPEFRRK